MHCVPGSPKREKVVLKIVVKIFVLKQLGIEPSTNISKIHGRIFEKSGHYLLKIGHFRIFLEVAFNSRKIDNRWR